MVQGKVQVVPDDVQVAAGAAQDAAVGAEVVQGREAVAHGRGASGVWRVWTGAGWARVCGDGVGGAGETDAPILH
ncbi:hypothetical protein GCM10008019_08910 [Deinococcus soli (ex Cha et al. 2016)]|nr:hypothetical protein GCM10008019_08910 [Deinococcus soli (ex Cha et al. 2016)]